MFQRSSRLLAAALLALVGAMVEAGCGGGAAPPAESPSTGDEASPEGALAALDRAERSLDAILGPRQGVTIAQQASASPMAPAAPEPPPPPPPPTSAPAGGAPPAAASGAVAAEKPAEAKNKKDAKPSAPTSPAQPAGDSCATACTALASMTRAADHVCALAGAADARCSNARDRVKNAAARVHSSCPVCS
jgi:hypothetical protein